MLELRKAKEFEMKSLHKLVILCTFIAATFAPETVGASSAPMKCSDVFGEVANEVQGQPQYRKDFGAGVFVQKINPVEFRIEPPPLVVLSARAAQRKLNELAGKDGDERFTVVFHGMSEGEVLGFKAMLQRDARLRGDDRLSAILLATENIEDGEQKGYERIRARATTVRDRLLRRYDWAKASVILENAPEPGPREVYRLTVEKSTEVEMFLLKLRLKAVQLVKNRTTEITSLLSSTQLVNATAEQMAHTVVSELKKTDKGISTGTLRVMAGDFVIAQTKR